uniref:Uncharacterized protein n=1 Tax=Anguilla anguilla TaxID=7936 RepID=A0A0E9RX86_ANGAN
MPAKYFYPMFKFLVAHFGGTYSILYEFLVYDRLQTCYSNSTLELMLVY